MNLPVSDKSYLLYLVNEGRDEFGKPYSLNGALAMLEEFEDFVNIPTISER
jgi:hypothetical protein